MFFDARGQERCLRVTWHEGTLVLSLWRGEMCTASFRMPMDDVGRLLDTLDDGFAEAAGEQPEQDPGAEVIPGTGQYHRPPDAVPHHRPTDLDERPTAALSPNDVLVARGTPAPPDKLVATGYHEQPRPPFTGPQYSEPQYAEPQYTEPQYTEPQYAEPAAASPGEPVYQLPGAEQPRRRQSPSTDPLGFQSQPSEPFPSRQQPVDPYTQQPDPLSGGGYGQPSYQQPAYGQQPDPYAQQQSDRYGRQGEAFAPQHSDPFAAQPSDPYPTPDPLGTYSRPQHQSAQHQGAQHQSGQYQSGQQDAQYSAGLHQTGQQQPQRSGSQGSASTPGLGTPMHGIPGAGRRSHDNFTAPPGSAYAQQQQQQPNPVDPLLALGTPQEPEISRPYVGDPMFSTGERMRPEQQYDDRGDRREW
ncbi:hypothetical protein OIE66_11230 [Nonomuraea sp. NBC_01738]|uniref:hypothetical protein n=1 Tax=Nonomuraea sp. NBC_01738 TaxID=2976003 RepID=UPI002E10D0AF|nr:hypothetical protein OIE66_11230 [Nonomuraea sp. NBC_01738]